MAGSKCHLNAMVADTKKWEQSAAFSLDIHPGVVSWVKNDHLGLHIPYRRNGSPHKYLPDFIVQLDTGLMLLVEIKGQVGDDAQIKQSAALRWTEAVSRCRKYGQWDYRMVTNPADLSAILDGMCKDLMERSLEKLEN